MGLITVFMMVRVYHLFRLFSIYSKFRTPRSQRVCKMNGANANSWFAIKCMIQAKPIQSVAYAFCLGILVLGYSLRVFEQPIDEYSQKEFANLGNAIWCVIITMTTVGYGDYYPVTIGGRFIGFIACLYGVLIVSLMVVTITGHLYLDDSEKKSLLILHRLKFKHKMRQAAASVITSAVRYKLMIKFGFTKDLIWQLTRFRRAIHIFRELKVKNIRLYCIDSFEDRVDSRLLNIVQMHSNVDEDMKECEKVFKKMIKDKKKGVKKDKEINNF